MTTNRIIAILALMCFMGACIGSFYLGRVTTARNTEVKRDTVYKYDTVVKWQPQPTSSKVVGTQKVKAVAVKPQPQLSNKLSNKLPNCSSEIERRDSIAKPPKQEQTDSAEVELPITERTYVDEQYKIVIEGYNPVLKSLEVYPRTVYISTTEKVKESRFAVVFGAQAGAGWTPKGFQPYAGFGATIGVEIKF